MSQDLPPADTLSNPQPKATKQPAPAPSASRRVGSSFRRSYERRLREGFIAKYLSGQHILDIGFRGRDPDVVPITDTAIGIDRDYPGYDGTHLPFPDLSQDTVLAAHVLEHIPNYRDVLKDWYRVLRVGGYLIIMVPHRYLYERRPDLPSRWNPEHCRFYTTASLLAEIEECLPTTGFRIRHVAENDEGFNYSLDVSEAPRGCFEIELVVEKIEIPNWVDKLNFSPAVRDVVHSMDDLVYQAVAASLRKADSSTWSQLLASINYFTPWHRLQKRFIFDGVPAFEGERITEEGLRMAVRPLLDNVAVDEKFYRDTYPPVATAHQQGKIRDLSAHWRDRGYFGNRLGSKWDAEHSNV